MRVLLCFALLFVWSTSARYPSTAPASADTTTDCGHDFDCSDKDDGMYADPFNCRKYWECSGGRGIHQTCPNDWLWREEKQWCDFQENVDCGDRPICGPCDEDCHTNPPTSTRASCTHECTADGDFAEECCGNSYCECFAGNGYLMHCSEGLVFNEAIGTCDWPTFPCCA